MRDRAAPRFRRESEGAATAGQQSLLVVSPTLDDATASFPATKAENSCATRPDLRIMLILLIAFHTRFSFHLRAVDIKTRHT